MSKYLCAWLKPTAEDAGTAHQQYLLNIVLVGIIGPALLFSLIMAVMWGMGLVPLIAVVVGLAVQPFYALAYFLGRRGRVTLAAYVIVGSVFITLALSSLYVGLGHIILAGLGAVTALAGILIGFRAALILALLSGLLHLLVGMAQVAGRLPNVLSPEATFIPEAVGLSLVLLTLALLNWFSRRELCKSQQRQQRAETLHRSNEEYRAIFDAMGDWIHVVDANLRIVLCNAAMQQAIQRLGLDIDPVGKSLTSVFNFLPPHIHAEYQEVLASGLPLVSEEHLELGGQTFITETRKIPVLEAGQVVQIVTVIRDITTRKQSEAALRESEQRYRRLVKISPDAIVLTDLEGNILVCNQQTAALYGAEEPDTLVGRSAFEFIAPEDQIKARASIQETLGGAESIAVEYRILRKDNTSTFVELHTTLLRDADGKPQGFIGVARDISERKQAEMALRHYAERLEIQHKIDLAILKAQSPKSIYQVTLQNLHHITSCSCASVTEIDLASSTAEEIVIFHPDGRWECPEKRRPLANAGAIIDSLRAGQPYVVRDLRALAERSELEKRLFATGVLAYFSVPMITADCSNPEDELVGALNLSFETGSFTSGDVEIAQEIAASLAVAIRQARLHEQVQKDAQIRSDLLREVNHRVGNTLAALLSILGVEGQQAEREGKAAAVEVVGRLSRRVQGLAMVHRMLSRSKWEPVPLCMLATEVLQAALNALPPDKYVCIKVTPSPVVVSPKQAANLALIFNELMINTVKYGLEGRTKGKVDVEIACHDGWIDLVYRDDGAGYTEAVLEGQERNIGLHLLQRMIKTLHGKLDVSNDNGAVTRLRFPARLPLAGCVSLLGKGRHRAHQLTDKVT